MMVGEDASRQAHRLRSTRQRLDHETASGSPLAWKNSNPLSEVWQKHVLASSGYIELGMLDDAALVLEEIKPEDRTRTEVLGARVALYIAAKKWDMAAAVGSHLVKVEPEN